ncbi:MAG: hypothetical protein ACE5KE_04045 [Methanosarcinales archaeon]
MFFCQNRKLGYTIKHWVFLFQFQEIFLFFNPVDGILKPQSKIVKKAIEAIYLENINKRKI